MFSLALHSRVVRAQAEPIPPELAVEPSEPAPQPARPSAPSAAGTPQQSQPEAILTFEQRSRFQFLPYLGLNLPMGDGWAGWKPSGRLGALLGWRLAERASIHAELDIEYERPDRKARQENDACKDDDECFWTGFFSPPRRYIDVAASPLVEFGRGQIRLGPKIGWFTSSDTQKGKTSTSSGVLFGLNAGLFVPWGPVTIVGLVDLNFRIFAWTACSGCLYPSDAHHTLGLSGGVLL
jgi:hypothetical protein